VKALETLASVWKPHSKKENERRPHRCVVKWGKTVNGFRCVIESLSTKYTMFSDAGVPLRATCTVKFKEADVVTMAKFDKDGNVITTPDGFNDKSKNAPSAHRASHGGGPGRNGKG
jgi:hypothetical protein